MSFNCHLCKKCLGKGCIGELPGMGGFNDSVNFQSNCRDWKNIRKEIENFAEISKTLSLPNIRLAPITGAVENVGWEDEESFYFEMTRAAYESGAKLSIGDGCPDIKIQNGIKAIKALQESNPQENPKAAVFIKPYPNPKIQERIDWAKDVSEIIGVDIDSYNIVTMRNLVQLERKTPTQIQELKKYAKLPFAVKGVFTQNDVELVKEIKPEIVVISNHGGRVENRIGSTAMFLKEYGSELKNYCDELWVDGGLRTKKDLLTASYFGVSEVMLGRPFITALCRGGSEEVCKMVNYLGKGKP